MAKEKTNEIIEAIRDDLATSCDQACDPGHWFALSEIAYGAMIRIRFDVFDVVQGERALRAARAVTLVHDLAHQQWERSTYKSEDDSLKECIGQAIRLI